MTSLQLYLDRAVKVLDKFHLAPAQDEASQMSMLLQDAVRIDEAKVLAVARILQYMGTFNQLVRDNLEQINIADRYNDIAALFDSVREDSKTLVDQLADGKIDFSERFSNWVMRIRRGSPHKRFEKIKDIYLDVTKDTQDHLQREQEILDAYTNFRLAIKNAEGIAYELLAAQEGIRSKASEAFSTAVKAVQDHVGEDKAEKSRLELARDEAQRVFKEEDKRYQLVKDVAENLTIGYHVGETLMAKLQQTHDVKDQVYRKSVTFFTTNEHVFTTMDAVYTSQHGLHEATQTVKALEEGANRGLEDIAQLAGNLERAALEAGYGKTIDARSVQTLVDAIVSYQEQSAELIGNLRRDATANAREVQRIVDDGKERYRVALERFAAPAA